MASRREIGNHEKIGRTLTSMGSIYHVLKRVNLANFWMFQTLSVGDCLWASCFADSTVKQAFMNSLGVEVLPKMKRQKRSETPSLLAVTHHWHLCSVMKVNPLFCHRWWRGWNLHYQRRSLNRFQLKVGAGWSRCDHVGDSKSTSLPIRDIYGIHPANGVCSIWSIRCQSSIDK